MPSVQIPSFIPISLRRHAPLVPLQMRPSCSEGSLNRASLVQPRGMGGVGMCTSFPLPVLRSSVHTLFICPYSVSFCPQTILSVLPLFILVELGPAVLPVLVSRVAPVGNAAGGGGVCSFSILQFIPRVCARGGGRCLRPWEGPLQSRERAL